MSLSIAAIGDSLTQGFMGGAISRTDLSFPSLVARSMGLAPAQFTVPSFPRDGLPLNLERLFRGMEAQLGHDIEPREWILRFPALLNAYMDEVEDCYERGPGFEPANFNGVYDNLAVWGFTANDAATVTPRLCTRYIDDAEGWIHDDLFSPPSAPMYRTARRVLNPRGATADPHREDDTQIGALARRIAERGAPDVLFLFLGANDCLGTVAKLKIKDMASAEGPIPNDPKERRDWNLTSAGQFAQDYDAVVRSLDELLPPTTQVFVGTVPHVTIPPVTTGLGDFDGRYFDTYSRFFVNDDNFHSWPNRHLSRAQMKGIDDRIDAFNQTVRGAIEARANYHLVDTCGILDSLAVKRNENSDDPGRSLTDYYRALGRLDHPLLRLDPVPSILMLTTTERGVRTGGGLMSLDGIHPSTLGYGIVAEGFLAAMQQAGVEGADPRRLDWDSVIAQDTLLHTPPKLWDDVFEAARGHSTIWEAVFRLLG